MVYQKGYLRWLSQIHFITGQEGRCMPSAIKTCLQIVLIMVFAGGCHGGSLPDTQGEKMIPRALDSCPQSPNCVSSADQDPAHHIAPLQIKGDIAAGWDLICAQIALLPRTTRVRKTPVYLHVECRSLIFRFVDDLRCLLDRQTGEIAVRSSSRKGYSDFGVNRRRVETLREQLKKMDLIE